MEKVFFDLGAIVNDSVKRKVEHSISLINYNACSEYGEKIRESYGEGIVDQETYRILIQEHYRVRDRILEEHDEKSRGKIDYDAIYDVCNVNQIMANYVNTICQEFDTYVIFYYNTQRDYDAKKELCTKLFKRVKIVGIKYYQTNYVKGIERKRTNKAQYIKKELDLPNLRNCILIDKSSLGCSEWKKELGESFLRQSSLLDNNLGQKQKNKVID